MKKFLTPAQQLLNLRSNPICAGVGKISSGRLVWRFWAQPSAISRSYLIRIEFEKDNIPEIYVEAPDLHLLSGTRKIPHVYSEVPLKMCLYLPVAGEWNGGDRIDTTIVPWAYVWLHYFEEWLWSNEWKGGGMHPGDIPPNPSNRRQRRLNQNVSRRSARASSETNTSTWNNG